MRNPASKSVESYVVPSMLMAWNDFWFAPRACRYLSFARMTISAIALVQLVVYAFRGPSWIGPGGWLNHEASTYLIGQGVAGTGSLYRWSILYVSESATAQMVIATLGGLACLAMLLGMGGRLAPLVAWIAMIQFQHRMPGLLLLHEPLLSSLLAYLIVDPGKCACWLRPGLYDSQDRVSANVASRLIELHLMLWMVWSFSSMLGDAIWWNGQAVGLIGQRAPGWLAINQTDNWLGQLWTHLIVASQGVVLLSWFAPRGRSLRMVALAIFAASACLILGDGMYGALILAASLPSMPNRD